MYYLEDEHTDLIMGDPLESDTLFMMAAEKQDKGKDSDGEKSPAEESTEEVVEEGAEAKDDASTESEAPVEEIVEEAAEATEEETPTEDPVVAEAPVEEEEIEAEPAEAAEAEEPVAEEALAEEDKEPARPEMDPEEAAYVAQQTEIIKATYFDIRKDLPKFRPGDKISVGYRVIEGDRSRIQNFDGVVIKISSGHGMDKSFTVRKVSSGIGVERIFPLHSPNIKSIKVLKEGHVRRAKLYYLRSRVGKATRIKDRTTSQ